MPKFPERARLIRGYSGFGAINPSYRTYKSSGANGSYSKFVGTHTFKMGADYREIGVYLLNPGNAIAATSSSTRSSPRRPASTSNSTTEGNAFASFLLGYPTADAARQSTMTLTTPLDIYTNYFGGYWQDDWRVSSKFTLNYGLRVEHEDGMREVEQQLHRRLRSRRPRARCAAVTIPADRRSDGGTPARTVDRRPDVSPASTATRRRRAIRRS